MYQKMKKPLYHGTTCSNIRSIMSQGLVVGEPVHSETYDPRDRVGKRAFRRGVYVTKDLEGAVNYAYDASKECDPEYLESCSADPDKMCVVVITKLPKDAKVGPDGYGDLMINKCIPPDCLKVLKPRDLKKKLKTDDLMSAF